MSLRHGIDHRLVFDASSTPMLVIDPDLVIVTANRSYLSMTNLGSEAITGQPVFDVFPDNPGVDGTVGESGMRASFRHVLETGGIHRIGVYRYDLARPDAPGGFEERYWSAANAPILDDDGEAVGIVHSVEDVTGFRVDLIRALDFYRSVAEGADEPDAQELDHRFERYAGVTAEATQLYSDLVHEVDNLRRALTSRASIDQAKGIVMARYGCDPEQAFAMLSRMSQEQNHKLRDVAATFVRQARLADHPVGSDGAGPDGETGSAEV